MRILIIGFAAVFCLFSMSGCQTTKNAVTGVAHTTYMVSKGVVEDVAVPAGAVMAGDQWVKDNYW